MKKLSVILLLSIFLSLCCKAEPAFELFEDFSGGVDGQSFMEDKEVNENWTPFRASYESEYYDAIFDNGALKFGPFTQLVSKRAISGKYTFSCDVSLPDNQFFGIFVRTTGEDSYFETDSAAEDEDEKNESLGATGLYIIPRADEIILCVKIRKGIQTTDKTSFPLNDDITNEYHNYRFEDDGEGSVALYYDNSLVFTVVLSEKDSGVPYSFYKKADVYSPSGELIKTIEKCRVTSDISVVALGMRIDNAHVDNISLIEYKNGEEDPGITEEITEPEDEEPYETEPYDTEEPDNRGIFSLDMKYQPEKYEYLLGEELDLSDTFLEVTYDNMVKEDIKVTPDMVTGFESDTEGVKQITVAYKNRSAVYSVYVVKEYGQTETQPPETIYIDTSVEQRPVNSDSEPPIAIIIIVICVVLAAGAVLVVFVFKGKKEKK